MPSKPLDVELAEQVIQMEPENVAVFCSTFRQVDATSEPSQVWQAYPEARSACMQVYTTVADKVVDADYRRVIILSSSFPNGMKHSHIDYGYRPEFSDYPEGLAIIMGIACDAVLNRIEILWENMADPM